MDSPTPEGDVTIECLQSSQFVVGKQTDFNGPVTIINCAHAPPKERRQEKILIRDKVHVPPDVTPTSHKRRSSAIFLTFVLICVGLTATAAVRLTLLLPKEPTKGTLSSGHPVYWKDDWEGRPAKSIVKMKFPIPYVVVSHTVTPLCHGLKTCGALIRNMQSYHFGLQYADIGYNFLVDSSGSIYEGRGWDRRNVKGGFVNGRNIDIALIGDYSDAVKPTREVMDGLRHLLDVGLAEGKISQRYSLIAANSTYATLSPGKNVYDVIKHWPHFDPHPEAHIKEYEE